MMQRRRKSIQSNPKSLRENKRVEKVRDEKEEEEEDLVKVS